MKDHDSTTSDPKVTEAEREPWGPETEIDPDGPIEEEAGAQDGGGEAPVAEPPP